MAGTQRWDEPLHVETVRALAETKAQLRQSVSTMLATVESETASYQGKSADAFGTVNQEVNQVSRAIDTYFAHLDSTMTTAKAQLEQGLDTGAQQHRRVDVQQSLARVQALPGFGG